MNLINIIQEVVNNFIYETKIVVDDSTFPPQKIDPTQYDAENDIILVKSSYDTVKDPAGWMVHEKVHAKLRNTPDDGKQYPSNSIERAAYTEQFKYLKQKGYTFDQIFTIPTMEHKKRYYNILKNACEGFRLNYKKINPIGIINGWIDCIRMKTSRSG